MDINNPQIFDHLVASSGETLRVKLVDIGDWDMDADAQVIVAHGLTGSKIITVTARIDSDTGTAFTMLCGMKTDPYTGYGGFIWWGTGNIVLMRVERGHFDNADFDETPLNRGVITILYTD